MTPARGRRAPRAARRRKLVRAVPLAVAVATLGIAGPAAAEPGDLDGAYGDCGLGVMTGAGVQDIVGVADVVAQPSGRTVEFAVHAGGTTASLVRLDRSGRPDPTFGTGGVVPLRLRPGFAEHPLLVTATGRLYAIGTTSGSSAYIEAFTVNGQLDTTFSTDGRAILRTGTVADAAVQPDGRLVILQPFAMTVARLELDGSIDPTFTTNDPVALRDARSVALATNGDVLVGTPDDAGTFSERVRRYGTTGNLISSTTLTETSPGGSELEYRAPTITPLPDGAFAVTRNRWAPDRMRTYVTRFLANGALDPAFGVGGRITVEVGDNSEVTTTRPLDGGEFALLVSDIRPASEDRGVQLQIRTVTGALDGRTGPPIFVDPSVQPRGIARSSDWIAVGLSVLSPVGRLAGVFRYSMTELRQGAGLMLQWNGDAWPTRFGADPGPECPYNTPYWPDGDLARGITTVTGRGGYVVDAYGGTHRFSVGLHHPRPPKAVGGPYWPGWDITRGIASKPDGTGGYLLDAWGGMHTYRTGTNPAPDPIVDGPYWPGWDITRGVALLPDGTRGYLLDGFGGIHRFTTPGHALPPSVNHNAYWPGWDIARGIAVLPDGTGGYVVDAYGGAHPFGIGTHAPPPGPGPNAPYAAGEDWVRGFTFLAPEAAGLGAAATTEWRATGSTGAPRATPRPRDPTRRGPA